MTQIVECVPNFSEGQQKEVVEAIASAINATPGINLLDVDPGPSTNRTVYTFVGNPISVIEGALNGARAAMQLIDMRKHKGEHPRIGAMDVCPFIPVKNVTMEECVECAKEFAERLALELDVPVYLYGEAAVATHRKTVPQIRAGEYEGLPEKLVKEDWAPDFGPNEFRDTWGATMVGARKFLIAYNINLLSTKEQAHRIALNIREQGRGEGEVGRLKGVQAIGWFLDEANLAQVSVNITDYDVTPIHTVFEEVKKDAEELNLGVCGSQIVGLVPQDALMAAADYYMQKEKLFLMEEEQKLRLVVERLGLNSLNTFTPKDRIIEFMIGEEPDGPLVSMDLREFVGCVAARTPSPGGGTVAAFTCTMGAALASMTSFLSYGNRKFSHLDDQMRQILPKVYQATKDLLPYVDADASAFNQYMKARKLPKGTPEETELRDEAMQHGLRTAISVPMNVCLTVNAMWPTLIELAKICNISCKSDLMVGVKSLETGVWGAYQNVMINLEDLAESDIKSTIKKDADRELETAQKSCAQVLKVLEGRTVDTDAESDASSAAK